MGRKYGERWFALDVFLSLFSLTPVTSPRTITTPVTTTPSRIPDTLNPKDLKWSLLYLDFLWSISLVTAPAALMLLKHAWSPTRTTSPSARKKATTFWRFVLLGLWIRWRIIRCSSVNLRSKSPRSITRSWRCLITTEAGLLLISPIRLGLTERGASLGLVPSGLTTVMLTSLKRKWRLLRHAWKGETKLKE